MIVLFANILTFSTGSAGLRTNSSDNLLNRNSSFGRPSFFSSWQTRLINIQDSPFIDQGKRGKAGWFENSETLSSSCLSTGVHLLALFSTVTIPVAGENIFWYMTFPTPDFGIDEKNLHCRLHPTSQTRGDPKAEGSLCLKWFEKIHSVFFNWYPPKNSKYKKVNLG